MYRQVQEEKYRHEEDMRREKEIHAKQIEDERAIMRREEENRRQRLEEERIHQARIHSGMSSMRCYTQERTPARKVRPQPLEGMPATCHGKDEGRPRVQTADAEALQE